jgi:hypothetical protein
VYTMSVSSRVVPPAGIEPANSLPRTQPCSTALARDPYLAPARSGERGRPTLPELGLGRVSLRRGSRSPRASQASHKHKMSPAKWSVLELASASPTRKYGAVSRWIRSLSPAGTSAHSKPATALLWVSR